ncbi:MAG: DUF2848 domain-containing protein [Alphaproteobacteria bacterium]|nr:DUF2848 domain-containing protein [Alphaproteobacteria bacterium]
MARLEFAGHALGGVEPVRVEIGTLIVAGWTGRDLEALNHHIEELKAIGVQPPSSVPLYYRIATQMLTQTDRIQAVGPDSSGEVEPVLVGAADRLWVTVGSDHTDRRVESYGVAVSKQMCPKVLTRGAWRFEEVEPHWDRLILRSFILEGGKRVPYQEGTVGRIRAPRELISGWQGGNPRLPAGALMFCGTLPAIGKIRPSGRFEMELEDPVLGRRLAHAYDIDVLPLIE